MTSGPCKRLRLHLLEVLHIPPSPPVGDPEFTRWAYLDAAGILPAPAEVEQFLKDPSPDKRDRLIDAIMKRPESVDYWAYTWSDLLLVSSNHLSNQEMWSYYHWIRTSVASNKAWDKFVYQIMTATGDAVENGAPITGSFTTIPRTRRKTWRRCFSESPISAPIATIIPWTNGHKKITTAWPTSLRDGG